VMTRRDAEGTRGALLEAAFQEMHEHGVGATSLDSILSRTKLTKGALYHHFPNKDELVLAVVDEVIVEYLHRMWIDPVVEAEDPIGALASSLTGSLGSISKEQAELGCPLNRLAQESESGSRLQARIDSVYHDWHNALVAAFTRGQQSGHVRTDIDPIGAATFVVACNQGFSGLLRCETSRSALDAALPVYLRFLDSLRPATQEPDQQ